MIKQRELWFFISGIVVATVIAVSVNGLPNFQGNAPAAPESKLALPDTSLFWQVPMTDIDKQEINSITQILVQTGHYGISMGRTEEYPGEIWATARIDYPKLSTETVDGGSAISDYNFPFNSTETTTKEKIVAVDQAALAMGKKLESMGYINYDCNWGGWSGHLPLGDGRYARVESFTEGSWPKTNTLFIKGKLKYQEAIKRISSVVNSSSKRAESLGVSIEVNGNPGGNSSDSLGMIELYVMCPGIMNQTQLQAAQQAIADTGIGFS